ncbi:MAG: hypothetical protein ACK5L0_04695 [Candidatus Fimivivens sp.]
MGLFSKRPSRKEAIDQYDAVFNVLHKDGLSVLGQNSNCFLCVSGDALLIKDNLFNDDPIATMQLSQITYIDTMGERELIEKSKNAIGRSIVGGLAFGSVGAIVGGLSAASPKQVSVQHSFLLINYIPSGSNTPVPLTFEFFPTFEQSDTKFINAVQAKIASKTVVL